ncbi:hypothetical protein Slin14017_G054550 [Septoria linicola]|nr:hypothetical protein Slin14017_G054550 [Septoria linicola]
MAGSTDLNDTMKRLATLVKPGFDHSSSGPIYETLPRTHGGKLGFVVFCTTYEAEDKWVQFIELLTDSANFELEEDSNFDRGDFCEWVASVDMIAYEPKYLHFVLADAEVVESVLTGEDPRAWQKERAYVKLVNSEWDEDLASGNDNDFPAIDGCTTRDVGWMNVYAQYLFPRTYRLLQGCGWWQEYRRPPMIKGDFSFRDALGSRRWCQLDATLHL